MPGTVCDLLVGFASLEGHFPRATEKHSHETQERAARTGWFVLDTTQPKVCYTGRPPATANRHFLPHSLQQKPDTTRSCSRNRSSDDDGSNVTTATKRRTTDDDERRRQQQRRRQRQRQRRRTSIANNERTKEQQHDNTTKERTNERTNAVP